MKNGFTNIKIIFVKLPIMFVNMKKSFTNLHNSFVKLIPTSAKPAFLPSVSPDGGPGMNRRRCGLSWLHALVMPHFVRHIPGKPALYRLRYTHC